MASRYIYNTIDAVCGGQSPVYTVDNAPVRLTVTGLLPGQTIPVRFRMSGDCYGPNGSPCARHLSYTTAISRGGCLVELSDTQTQIVEVLPGTYELDTSTLPPGQPVAVLVEELAGMAGEASINFALSAAQCAAATCPAVPPLGVTTSWG